MAVFYRKVGTTPMYPWCSADDMTGISVSEDDRRNGSPKPGDMIAYDEKNPKDRWLVNEAYFRANYERAD